MFADPLGPPGGAGRPDLGEWLATGRLTLLDAERRVLAPDDWERLPPHLQARAEAEFRRLVRGSAKAAVLYLK